MEENPSESQKEHLKSLKFSGDYLLAFINDILQINKIEAKKLNIQNIDFDINKIIKDVISSLTQTAKENKNTVNCEIDSNIPKQLKGDPLKLSQIFINLVSNGLKFTENGEVKLKASLVSRTENRADILFEIIDTGIGISDDMIDNIFESFAQGSIQINRKYGGTGLGLTIVKNLLELMDSKINVKSELGKGSTFTLPFHLKFQNNK